MVDIQRTLDKMKILYRMQVARNGEEGLQFLEESRQRGEAPPDVVLVDINMPKMDGLEFLAAVRASPHWKGLKCFVITSSEEEVDRQEARRLGISGYIVKPFKINHPGSMDSFNLMIDLMNM